MLCVVVLCDLGDGLCVCSEGRVVRVRVGREGKDTGGWRVSSGRFLLGGLKDAARGRRLSDHGREDDIVLVIVVAVKKGPVVH